MRNDKRYVKPDEFNGARFIDDELDSATSAHSMDWSQRDHVHFGWGRRLCPGVYAADICIFLAVSRVLWGFTIRPHPDHPFRMEDVSGGSCNLSHSAQYEIVISVSGADHARRWAAEEAVTFPAADRVQGPKVPSNAGATACAA
jgi:hypothetical protein